MPKTKGSTQHYLKCEKSVLLSYFVEKYMDTHLECNTVGEKKCAGRRIVKILAVVALDAPDGDAKLRADIGEEIRNSEKCLRF